MSLLSETLNTTSSNPLPILLDDFFNALRAFANQHKMAMITTSEHTLRELTETQGLTSPLWNLFMVQPVGEFAVSDIVDEVTLFLTRFWIGELQPNAQERAYLISYCSRHLLVMQVVSYWVLRNREMGLSEWALVEEIEKELSSYFRDKRECIQKWLGTKGLKAFKSLIWTSEHIGKIVKNLSPFSIHLKD